MRLTRATRAFKLGHQCPQMNIHTSADWLPADVSAQVQSWLSYYQELLSWRQSSDSC